MLTIEKSVLAFEEFKDLAKKFTVVDIEDFLDFFHSQVGILLWFKDNANLKKWVFNKPSFLFTTVTAIIENTFIEPSDNQKIRDKMQKCGIFEGYILEEIFKKKIQSEDCELKWDQLLEVFIHLRMIAILNEENSNPGKKKYFIPCVLERVPEPKDKKSEEETSDNKNALVSSLYYSWVPW